MAFLFDTFGNAPTLFGSHQLIDIPKMKIRHLQTTVFLGYCHGVETHCPSSRSVTINEYPAVGDHVLHMGYSGQGFLQKLFNRFEVGPREPETGVINNSIFRENVIKTINVHSVHSVAVIDQKIVDFESVRHFLQIHHNGSPFIIQLKKPGPEPLFIAFTPMLCAGKINNRALVFSFKSDKGLSDWQ
jgi:hypothetical protein